MNYFSENIEKLTKENTDYRRVIFTSDYSQLVLMSIPVGEDIDFEIHPYVDQFFRFESGEGEIYLGKNKEVKFSVKDGSGVIIPHNTYHYVKNVGKIPLKLYTIYSPPSHGKDHVEHVKVPEENKYKKMLLKLLNHL